MKTFNEYLTESKKTYGFRIKVAGNLAEGFADKVKSGLAKYSCMKVEKSTTTPIRPTALDFPELKNIEVTMFEAECEYPVTPQQISIQIREFTGMPESHFRVRNLNDTAEESYIDPAQPSGKALLNTDLTDPEKIRHKDYFGDDHVTNFLKDIAKEAKARKKDEGQNVEYKLPKHKEDKAGTNSAVGSK